jgi:hypothetical protein
MPSTFTSITGIEKIADGEQSGLWGQTTNLNLDIIDRSLNGSSLIALSGTAHTLTTSDGALSDGQFAVLLFGGSPSGTNTVTIAPNTAQKTYMVRNDTSETVVLSQGSGATVSLLPGTSRVVFTNGGGSGAAVSDITNTLAMGSAAISGGTINGTTVGATSASTGAFTTLSSSGTTTLNGTTIPASVTLVSTTATQTLTNKTISGSNNTLSNIANASLTNSSLTVNGTSVALGASATITAVNPQTLTIGTGLSGTSYNGSAATTVSIDSTVATLTGTQTLTNKRINPRAVNAPATSGTLTINGDTTDLFVAEGLTGAITLAQPSGTPVNGQKLLIRLKDDGTARGITWTTSSGAFREIGITLPTTTVLGKVTYVGCVYNSADNFWDAVATVTQA